MAEEKQQDAQSVFEAVVSQENKDMRFMVIEVDGDDIKVAKTGSQFDGFPGAFDDSKVQWGAFCCHGIDRRASVDSIRTKVIMVNWIGENVKPMQRMKASQGRSAAGSLFGSPAVVIDANSAEDIDMKEVAIKLADCGGAHKPTVYEFGGGIELSLADIGKDVSGDAIPSE